MDLQLDKEIIELRAEYEKFDREYGTVLDEIEDLERDKERIEEQMSSIENQIKRLEENLYNSESTTSDDIFLNDFVKASQFCNRSNETETALDCVNIVGSNLIGCDGYRIILIRNGNIPDALKNKLIKWNTRENFEKCIEPEGRRYLNAYEIVEEIMKRVKYYVSGVTSENFNDLFRVEQVFRLATSLYNLRFRGR